MEISYDQMDATVSEILREIGVPANLNGYRYVREAIKIAVKDISAVSKMTKKIYPQTAEKCGTTATRAERSIRSAIEKAWDRGDEDVLKKYFGNTVSASKGKATNSEFIATIAEHILQNA